MKNAICLVIDRLSLGFLGCYGATWIATPAFDRLASQSLVFDQAYLETPDLKGTYESLWTGRHALERAHSRSFAPGSSQASLIRTLAEAGANTTLITDEPAVRELPLAGDFAEVVPVQDAGGEETPATELARFFALAAQEATNLRPPYFLWLHSKGMSGDWDAPLELRRQYATEDDPTPSEIRQPPSLCLPPQDDPDRLLDFRLAYAGQVSHLDDCLEAFLDVIDGLPDRDETLLVLLSPRGFPLGEHGWVGAKGNTLHGEAAHIPWLARFPASWNGAGRSQALVQTADWAPTLAHWFGVGGDGWSQPGRFARGLAPLARGEIESLRDRICLFRRMSDESSALDNSRIEWATRTPAWYLREAPSADESELPPNARAEPTVELYGKPDDRWEQNDVANRHPEVVEAMRSAREEFSEACRSGSFDRLPGLGPWSDSL